MVKIIEGQLAVKKAKFGIVVSRFNEIVTRLLLEGALDTFRRHLVPEKNITVVKVPGAFEIPLVAQILAGNEEIDAVCCLGAVIQGETTHHEYINHSVANSLMEIGLEHAKPVLFGILTCQTLEQAMNRAGGKAGNKGSETALAAIEMVSVSRQCNE